jgi:hypothetical protein
MVWKIAQREFLLNLMTYIRNKTDNLPCRWACGSV